jgi:hypothetical protein
VVLQGYTRQSSLVRTVEIGFSFLTVFVPLGRKMKNLRWRTLVGAAAAAAAATLCVAGAGAASASTADDPNQVVIFQAVRGYSTYGACQYDGNVQAQKGQLHGFRCYQDGNVYQMQTW